MVVLVSLDVSFVCLLKTSVPIDTVHISSNDNLMPPLGFWRSGTGEVYSAHLCDMPKIGQSKVKILPAAFSHDSTHWLRNLQPTMHKWSLNKMIPSSSSIEIPWITVTINSFKQFPLFQWKFHMVKSKNDHMSFRVTSHISKIKGLNWGRLVNGLTKFI